MEDIVLTKTSQGFVPFSSIDVVEAQDPDDSSLSGLSFHLVSRRGEIRVGACPPAHRAPERVNIVDLAACMVPGERSWLPDYRAMAELARKTGPLFGDDSTATVFESRRSWANAAYAALIAVRLQECANGRSDVATLRTLGQPAKHLVSDATTGRSFTLYQVFFRSAGAYDHLFRHLEFIARLAVQEGAYYYTFIHRGDEDDPDAIGLTVVRLEQEITRGEFSYLCKLMKPTADDVRLATEQLGLASKEEFLFFSEETPYYSAEVDFNDGDRSALAALVQALILAHIRDARVDIFRGDRTTGYLSFDAFLSWLWYDFSGDLGTSSIGYCNNCGKPFSLVGHRGMDRLYCSRACKTEAKNAKVRASRERTRAMFWNGATVAQIAQQVYAGTPADEKRVRADLSKWVELKHRLDDSIEADGFRGSALFKRCVSERLAIEQLLTSRRFSELRKGMTK